MNNRDPNSKEGSNPSGVERREKIMKATNHEDKTEQSSPVGQSRRDFIVSAATAAASVGAANLLNLQPAQGANATNSVASGNGPYPTEGMAAYSPTGPHELMKFQRRALGPKDVAIKIHYCGICHSDIHMIRGDWGKITIPANRRSRVSGRSCRCRIKCQQVHSGGACWCRDDGEFLPNLYRVPSRPRELLLERKHPNLRFKG